MLYHWLIIEYVSSKMSIAKWKCSYS